MIPAIGRRCISAGGRWWLITAPGRSRRRLVAAARLRVVTRCGRSVPLRLLVAFMCGCARACARIRGITLSSNHDRTRQASFAACPGRTSASRSADECLRHRLRRAGARHDRPERLNWVAGNHHRSIDPPQRRAVELLRHSVHHDGPWEPALGWVQHCGWPDHRAIAGRRGADVRATVVAGSVSATPPGITAPHTRRPAPAE